VSTPNSRSSPDTLARRIAAEFGELPQVEAVAMAGSRVAGGGDEDSDVDLYVYASTRIALATRREIAARFAARREIGNAFWEPGDEWVDADTGIHVDVTYRTPAWIEEQLARILDRHEASIGYSTCLWHNVLHSVALFDRTGWFDQLQIAANRPYPEALRRAIVARNLPILRQTLSSYRHQIELASRRSDAVSVQHRVAALLASYFDVLFAVDKLPHPGEKSLLRFAARHCPRTPPDMERHVLTVLALSAPPPNPAILGAIDALVDGLDALAAAVEASAPDASEEDRTWPTTPWRHI
jgi:predicted nucleotidyltransferase